MCSDRRLQEGRRSPTERTEPQGNPCTKDLRSIYDGRATPSNSELLTANPDPLFSSSLAKKISYPGAEGEADEVSNSQRRMILLQSLCVSKASVSWSNMSHGGEGVQLAYHEAE